MDNKATYGIGFGIPVTGILGYLSGTLWVWGLMCLGISLSFVGHAYYEYRRANFHKFPLTWELAMAFLTPVLFPLLAIYSLPRDLRSWYVSKTTVRGVFEQFHSELTAQSKYQRDNPIADIRTAEVAQFFESYPHIFEGLPGGIAFIDDYVTHCQIALRLTSHTCQRYDIDWTEMAAFQKAIVDFNARKNTL